MKQQPKHAQSQTLTRSFILGGLVCLGAISGFACEVQSTAPPSMGIGGESGDEPDDEKKHDPNQEMENMGGSPSVSMGGMGGELPMNPEEDPKEDPVDDPIECPHGVSIVLSDYLSTQIALSDLDGKIRSESLVSTGSTTTDGLAFALSGDVALPSAAPLSGNVVLLDRFGTNVISWVNPKNAQVIEQLPVGTGFESNPQDYLEIDEKTAWVSRWGQNTDPGQESHDAGGDLLVLDLSEYSIKDSIVLESEDDLPPRPSALSRVGDEVFVTLDRIALDFSETGEARVAIFDALTGTLKETVKIEGRKACGRVTPSPDGKTLALSCTGALNAEGNIESLDQSALLLFDAEERPLKLLSTHEAEDLLGEPLQGDVAFANDETVLLKTQTPWGGDTHNRLFSLNLESEKTHVVLEAEGDETGAGKGLVYSRVVCAPGCTDTCLMADADQGLLRVLTEESGSWEASSSVVVEDTVGLPPRVLGLR